jgi:hypothetical protein
MRIPRRLKNPPPPPVENRVTATAKEKRAAARRVVVLPKVWGTGGTVRSKGDVYAPQKVFDKEEGE